MCGPVFNDFMQEAIKVYGGGKFAIPEGGKFIKIDRYTGARLADDASGESVVAEYFREGEEPLFGITFDGGFAMGSNLSLFAYGEDELGAPVSQGEATQVQTSTGRTVTVGPKATFGTLSSGGQY
jgi:penicillin-binding protein 1A